VKRSLLLLLAVSLPATAEDWLTVDAEDRPITVTANGIVESSDTLRFGPPATRSWRQTIATLAREGQMVSEGDVLASFDASSADDEVRETRAELNAKRTELESLLETQAREIEEEKVRLAEAESAAEKAARKADADESLYAGLEYQKLVEERRISAELFERESARRELNERVRRANRAELEADIRRLEAELAGDERALEKFTIRAPKAGLVIVGTDQAGQKLGANDTVNPGLTVVELADPDKLMVRAEVPEFAATKIAVGQKAEMVIDAAGGTTIRGHVIDVGSIVRRQSQYSQAMVRDVSIELPESVIASLRPGMTVKVTIETETQRAAVAVPDAVLQYRDGRPGVVVRGDGWREVRLGRASAGLRIIEDGLAAGERIALQ